MPTFSGTDDPETLNGTPGNDIIYAYGGDDTLNGGDGDDILYGGDGTDQMTGGLGDDIYIANGREPVVEAAGEGNDIVYTESEYYLPQGASVEMLAAGDPNGTTPIHLIGNSLTQTLIGNAGNNLLISVAGADVMIGLGGDDTYEVDTSEAQVYENPGEGNDAVYLGTSYAGPFDYHLAAGNSVELLGIGNPFSTEAISLYGNEFAQTIQGNDGRNIIDGGGGADVMRGYNGNDVYVADNAGDHIFEPAAGGSDILYSTVSWVQDPDSQVETLSTANWALTDAIDLTGNFIAQSLYGNEGSNVLDGKGGNDLLAGFGGADTYAFTTTLGPNNVDSLASFATGSDKIALDDAVFTGLGAGALNASAFVIGSSAGDADDRIIYDSAHGTLYYDADGNGAGAQVLFAYVAPGTAIVASDFTVI